MELFQLSIPVLAETCKGLEQDIEVYARLAEEVKYCCDHLTSQGWRGNSRDQFVRNYEVWYADSTAFINDLTTLHNILCDTLERAEDLNQEALYLPRLLGGGGGNGNRNILTYNEDSQTTIDYCHRKLQEDYEEARDQLEAGKHAMSGLSYARSTEDRLFHRMSRYSKEVAEQRGRLEDLQVELQRYANGIRELEAAAIEVTSEFQMPEGWTSRGLELTQQLASMTPGIGELNTNWSQMRDFIDKVWDTQSEVDQKFLLERLGMCLKGKTLQGVDSRTMLELLVLEEQRYIAIVDGGIVYHSDYVNNQLARPEMIMVGVEASYGALILEGLVAAAGMALEAAAVATVEVLIPAVIISGIASAVIATVYIGVTATPGDIPVELQEAREKGQLAMPSNATKLEVDGKPEEDSKAKGGTKAKDSGKNDPHGDGGRAQSKAEKQIQELEKQLKDAKGKAADKIKQKIQNIRKNAQGTGGKKGETHHRR